MSVIKKNTTYTLTGKITNLKGDPLNALTVHAYDKDPVSPDDELASAITDEKGLYTIHFTRKDFQIGGAESSGPDVYIKVYSGETFIAKSNVRNNSPKKTT